MTIKTIEEIKIEIPSLTIIDGIVKVRSVIQTWNTDIVDGAPVGEPEFMGEVLHRESFPLVDVLENPDAENEKGITNKERNARAKAFKLAELADKMNVSTLLQQTNLIEQKDATITLRESELSVEKEARKKSDDDCTAHVKTIAKLTADLETALATIAKLQSDK